MGCCKKCGAGMGLVLVVIGVLFVLQDREIWDFWMLNWYTVAFLLFGISMWGCSSCKDCNSCCSMPEKKTGKRKKK